MSHFVMRLAGLVCALCMASAATASVWTLPTTQMLKDPADPQSR
jgi:hypothetical protein